MKKKVLWLIMSFVLLLSLIAVTFTSAASPATTTMRNFQGKMVEKPTYGGTLNVIWPDALKINYWDEALGHSVYAAGLGQTNETLLIGDWKKGALGTKEASFAFYIYHHPSQTGHLAERWEIPDSSTMIFHIRKGVRWHDKPPVNGREMDANDVVFSLKRLWTSPKCAHYNSYPWKKHFQELNGEPYITATDKWTVVIKTLPKKQGLVFEWVAGHSFIIPHEVIDKYGNMEDWKNVIGTGPFILKEVIEGKSITWVKNPNYWMKDPVHPGMKLPYLDEVKFYTVPDMSTKLAMFRTGKADLVHGWLSGFSYDDIKTIRQSNPKIQIAEFAPTNPSAVFGRIDRKPFDDVRVRRALSMAIDRKSIAKNLYEDHAITFGFPVLNILEFKHMYRPLSAYPKQIQQIYEYNPQNAKQLLAEAGYPKGFKTKITCQAGDVDMLSIIKEYWAKIGVELEIDIKENAVYNSILKTKKHEAMIYGLWHPTAYFKFTRLMPGMTWNYSMVDDPKIKEAEAAMVEHYFDMPKRDKIFMDICPYLLEQCYGIEVPTSNIFALWQPWVKGYHGETLIGYSNLLGSYTRYIWKDTN